MPTGTAGTSARSYPEHQVHYLRTRIGFAMGAVVVPMGYIPAGAIVLRRGIAVITAFNYGTNNRADIGTVADDDGFAADVALGTVGVITTGSEMATSNDFYVTVDTLINVTLDLTGTAGTTGDGVAWIEYLIPDGLPTAS